MLNMDSASYSNFKYDMERSVRSALSSSTSRLDEISNLLSEIRDLLKELVDKNNE